MAGSADEAGFDAVADIAQHGQQRRGAAVRPAAFLHPAAGEPVSAAAGAAAGGQFLRYQAHAGHAAAVRDIATGNLEFFDNRRQTIRPEHVLASSSLPPGFPATAVDGKLYWDGACVSNTPLDAIIDEPGIDKPGIDEPGHPRMVVFMIDLWDPAGPPPQTVNAVLWRAKQIRYASRTAHHIEAVATKVNLRHAVRLLKAAGVAEVAAVPDDPVLTARRLDIVHIVYRPGDDQISNSDAEFSRSSIAERRAAGYRDMRAALTAQPWLRQEMPAHLGALVHRVEREQVITRPEPNLHVTAGRPATIGLPRLREPEC
jgi:NTE family protein